MSALLSHIRHLLVALLLMVAAKAAAEMLPADSASVPRVQAKADSAAVADSIARLAMRDAMRLDSMLNSMGAMQIDTPDMDVEVAPLAKAAKARRDWSTWRPDPKRAMWMALVIPGGGQIYNRKYWKLPIVYGGFVGCVYALMWNNMMYKDYAQAYLDIMDDDPTTASYNKFLHLGRQIDSSNQERYKTIFKRRKDKFRRWRDLSFFVMVGIYAVSVIDAYVDAELSDFDISKDLSLHLAPAVIPASGQQQQRSAGASLTGSNAVGLQCSLSF